MENEKVEETGMSFSDILFLLKKNLLLIIILTGVLTVLGGVYGFTIKKPTYTGTVTAIVMASESDGSIQNGTTSDFVYASYYTSVFKSLIESNPVMSATKEKLKEEIDLELTREQVKNCISVKTENNSLNITITASIKSKDENEGRKYAKAIANAVIECAVQEANKIATDNDGNVIKEPLYNKDGKPIVDMDGNQVMRDKYVYGVYANKLVPMELVEDLNEDIIARRGAGTTIIISFLIGIILSFGIILIKYLADDTFTSKEAFEKKFDIQVLSVIEEIKADEGGNK